MTETAATPLRIVSLGAGVQSTALALLAAEGVIEGCNAVIFADTGWEPRATYEHLGRLASYLAARSLPLLTVSKGNIRDDALNASKRTASMPLYTKDASGKIGKLRRQCTREYKVDEVHRKIRELLRSERPKPGSAECWVGISTDEAHRMKPTHKLYVVNRWPLIELGMSRADCAEYNAAHGFPNVPKSACIGCPFTDQSRWREMKIERPEEFADAVAFEREVRKSQKFEAEDVYLTRNAVPLDAIDFRNEKDAGQLDMFDEECEGMCGV